MKRNNEKEKKICKFRVNEIAKNVETNFLNMPEGPDKPDIADFERAISTFKTFLYHHCRRVYRLEFLLLKIINKCYPQMNETPYMLDVAQLFLSKKYEMDNEELDRLSEEYFAYKASLYNGDNSLKKK